MSIPIFEATQRLEEAVRNCEPFHQLRQVYMEVQRDGAARQMFDQFRSMQKELQTKQMSGVEVTEAELDALQQVIASIETNDKIRKLVEAEYRLNELFAQVTNAMFRPIEELYAGRS
jgi:cell fate (sporulation/competence/biofilm development) regulator YlbF (YheA/YmcA/DUF963 family)